MVPHMPDTRMPQMAGPTPYRKTSSRSVVLPAKPSRTLIAILRLIKHICVRNGLALSTELHRPSEQNAKRLSAKICNFPQITISLRLSTRRSTTFNIGQAVFPPRCPASKWTHHPDAPCPDGGIGRRAGLKHQWSNPCRFDPGSGYQTKCKCLIFNTCIFLFPFCTTLAPRNRRSCSSTNKQTSQREVP